MTRVLRALLGNRLALPAALLGAVGLAAVLSLGAGAGAAPRAPLAGTHRSAPSSATGAATGKATTNATATKKTGSPRYTPGATHFVNTKPKVTPTATACTQDAQRIGYKAPADSGSPQDSTPAALVCSHGKVLRYGDRYIQYVLPSSSLIATGHKLFEQNCSSCHLATAQGSALAPSLIGVGPATVEFWVTTGRMPAATPLQVQADQKPPRLSGKEAEAVAAWVNSLTPSAPYVPVVKLHHLTKSALTTGATLFALNCASCHTITGAGDALSYGAYAPPLRIATSQQVAEAIRTGPGNMPRFTGNLSDHQVADIVAYVTQKIQHPNNSGGFGLGGVGPVAEGFVALLFGVGGLVLVGFWIGERS